MKKLCLYGSVIASVIGLITVAMAGLKLANNNYDVVSEGIVIGICLAVLLTIAVYRIVQHNE